jgi:uncharacterized protein (TIGR04255 family)
MATQETLANAPIAEAILDVRVRARRDFSATKFRTLASRLERHYPQREERRGFRTRVEIPGGTPESTDLGVQGYFFKSKDGLDIAQFRIDGFTLNRLAPYSSWDNWFPAFERLWTAYVEIARPERVTRVATRAINHIELPLANVLLERYLAYPPERQPKLGGELQGFVSSMTLGGVGSPDTGLVLTQAMEQGTRRLIIDIDAFDTGDFNPTRIVGRFAALRDLRNRAFFDSITDRLKEMFI